MRATVKFYGNLKQFGTNFKLNVDTAGEALHALMTQIKGLRNHIQQGFYKIKIGNQYVTKDTVEQDLGATLNVDTIHVIPSIKGAGGGGGWLNIVAGIIIVAVSWWNPLGWSTGAVMAGYGAGGALMMSGVAQMLTKTPTMSNNGLGEEKEKKQSTAFSNLQNMVAQGHAVPLAYGRIMTGSLIISQGAETYLVENVTPETGVSLTDGKRGLSR